MKITTSHFSLFYPIVALLALSSCDLFDEKKDPEACEISVRRQCPDTSWSFVDSDTYESLLGYDKPIHPDSIVITNTRGDTMYHEFYSSSDGWMQLVRFSPFQEITCFNQCLLDSAFTRTYYMYLGNGDTDTVEAYFPVRSKTYHLHFNGTDGAVPDDRSPDQSRKSHFWFRKKLE